MVSRIFLPGIALFLVGGLCGCQAPSSQAGYQVEEKTLAELSADMASGKVTAEGLVAPRRPAGSCTVHDNRVAHGVTELAGGVRYGLFFLRE